MNLAGAGVKRRAKQWVRTHARILGSTTSLSTLHPHVVLTFDDGPDPVITPLLLGLLRHHQATATFFLLVEPAERHHDVVELIQAEGHEIALHGLDHRRLPRLRTREAITWLRTSRDRLGVLTGGEIKYFRPPHGAQSLITWSMARAFRMEVILWNSTTWDWKNVTQEERVAKALDEVGPGSILLAHDGTHYDADAAPPAEGVDKVELMELILTAYSARGLRCVSLRDARATGASLVKTVSFSS